MGLEVRKWFVQIEEIASDGGAPVAHRLRKVAVGAVIRNPYAGRWSESLDELVQPSGDLAIELVARACAALGPEAESCGKGAVVGSSGEQEHGVACLTTPFGDALRNAIGGSTWVASNTKVGGPGVVIDIPLAHKRALFVRSHYDTVSVMVADAPRPDEILVIAALASGGRIQDRLGGLRAEEATRGDGLR